MEIESLIKKAESRMWDYIDYVTPEYKYRIQITKITKLIK